VPIDRLESVTVACPLGSSGCDPSEVAPSENATVPVGVAPPDGKTTAVIVALLPPVAGDGAAVNVSVVVAAPIVTVAALEVDELKLVVAPYVAVIEACVPVDNAVVVKTAWPPLRFAVPSVPAPSENVTVPVGVLVEVGVVATIAVNVIVAPSAPLAGAAVSAVVVSAGVITKAVVDALDPEKFVDPE